MKWLEIAPWMLGIGESIALGMYLWRMKKIRKESQYDTIEAHLITIWFGIVTILFILAMDKIFIALAV